MNIADKFLLQPNADKMKMNNLTTPISLGDLYTQFLKVDLCVGAYFLACYNSIPHVITLNGMNGKGIYHWLIRKYENQIFNWHYTKGNETDKNELQFKDVILFLFEDLIIHVNISADEVMLFYRNTPFENVNQILCAIKKMRKQDSFKEPKLSLLINGPCGITTKALHLNRNKLSLQDNYNDDFFAIHELILKRLNKKNDKGLILLHGKPGTGKTSYIRHLASVIKKRIIFIPPNMASHLTNPGLMEILIDNQNSILIIEDAETMLIDRNLVGESPVSALLNLTDGLLSDCVNIQVICSFNTDLTKLDAALLRKGRLIARYEFKELEARKAQLLSNKLGFQRNIDQALTLTEIYNQQETTFETEIPVCKIGFRVQ